VSGDSLYVGSNDGHLYALDKATGEPQWRHKIGAWVASSPAVSGTGLVVGAFDGNLYGFALR
jgi:outer membrane protein assembly factor BamB